jgi:L-ascorbate metabolism protein UlaG (beta-lactamase superfamily)
MSEISIQVIGGPTAVLEYAGLRVISDPTFDQPRSYGSGPTTLTKLVGPAISPEQLGHVDAVLISHDQHPDNLDESGRTIALATPRVFTTAAAARRLGHPATGLRPYQHADVAQIRITAVPALHGPPETGLAIGPVIGFILESPRQPAVYISGDNASLDVVAGVAEQFPAIEIAILHIGAAKVLARGDVFLTLTAEHAVRAAALLGVKTVVPVHQDGWAHFTQGAEDVLRAFDAAGSSGSLIDLRPGGSVSLSSS